jgi:hypothetical protein
LTSSLMEKGSLEEMVLGPQPSLWRGSSKFWSGVDVEAKLKWQMAKGSVTVSGFLQQSGIGAPEGAGADDQKD